MNKRPLLSSVTWLICSTRRHEFIRSTRNRREISRADYRAAKAAPATGNLTLDEFGRLAEAARDIDDRTIGTTMKKTVVKDEDVVSATGTGGADDIANPLAPPSTLVEFAVSEVPAHAS